MFVSFVEEKRKMSLLYGKDARCMGENQEEDKREKSSKGNGL